MARIDWNCLPAEVRDAIAERTGPVAGARTASAGLNSEIAMIVDTVTGRVFVKGRPVGRPEQEREASIGPYVGRVSPRLLWHVPDAARWTVLGFEYVEGRHADYTPGSADVTAVVAALDMLGDLSCPDVPVKDVSRWRSYADGGDTTLFEGDTLLHTDWKPDNVLIEPDGTRKPGVTPRLRRWTPSAGPTCGCGTRSPPTTPRRGINGWPRLPTRGPAVGS